MLCGEPELGWSVLGWAEPGWAGLGWAGLTSSIVALLSARQCYLLPFSQLMLRRAAARHVPPPAPAEWRLAADGHAFSLTVGSA